LNSFDGLRDAYYDGRQTDNLAVGDILFGSSLKIAASMISIPSLITYCPTKWKPTSWWNQGVPPKTR
jgi:hypothetical protein